MPKLPKPESYDGVRGDVGNLLTQAKGYLGENGRTIKGSKARHIDPLDVRILVCCSVGFHKDLLVSVLRVLECRSLIQAFVC